MNQQRLVVAGLPSIREVPLTPWDELLLTELGLDSIDGLLALQVDAPAGLGGFKCFLCREVLYLEITLATPRHLCTRSFLLKVMDMALQAGCGQLVACFRKDTVEMAQYVESFQFIGFAGLSQQESQQLSHQSTHLFYSYPLKQEQQSGLDDLDAELEADD